jgi:hypothetical protein
MNAAAIAAPLRPGRLFTVHNTGRENVPLIHDPDSPRAVRRGGPPPIIVGRHETRSEADCTCLAANHAQQLMREPSSWPRLRCRSGVETFVGRARGRLSDRPFALSDGTMRHWRWRA